METVGIDRLGLASWAESIAIWLVGSLEDWGGPPWSSQAFGRVTWASVVVALCVILFTLFTLVVNGLLAALLRRRLNPPAEATATKDWRAQIFDVFGKPLYLLIWVFGISLAGMTLLTHYSAADGVHWLRRVLDRLTDLGLFAFVFWAAYRFTHLLEDRLRLWSARSESQLDDLLAPFLGKSLRLFLPVLAVILALPLIGLPPAYGGFLSKTSSLLIIGTVAYVLFQSVAAAEKVLLARYDIRQPDNLQARKLYTQVHVLSKTIYVLIGIFTIASALMLFEEVRRLGTSILASAGVVGIIIGFAAQRTIANLFAGFQLAMTQPIRIDDVVVVEGEWGRIEEITLTYVVVRIWEEQSLPGDKKAPDGRETSSE